MYNNCVGNWLKKIIFKFNNFIYLKSCTKIRFCYYLLTASKNYVQKFLKLFLAKWWMAIVVGIITPAASRRVVLCKTAVRRIYRSDNGKWSRRRAS
jgi:hypothetical protein